MEILRLAAFTTDPSGGNPAGVVIANAMPPDGEMQRIATQVGYSETAFLVPQPAARGDTRAFRVRYYSPVAEVPFCGHATIASGVALAERVGPGRFDLMTNGGLVPVDVAADAEGRLRATLTSVEPRVAEPDELLVEEALSALRWERGELDRGLPPGLAYAGAWHLILATRRRERLTHLRYDFDRLREVMLAADLTTVQLVWREAPLVFRARDPFPVGGVVEDPATGAAAAALGAYLRKRGFVAPTATITIHQGEEMGRPSVLTVDLVEGEQGVRVSGTAVAIPSG